MKNYIKKLLTLAIGAGIFMGIPYYFGWIFLVVSWFPSVIAMAYLDSE